MKTEVSTNYIVERVLQEWAVLAEFDATCAKLGGNCPCAKNLLTGNFYEFNIC